MEHLFPNRPNKKEPRAQFTTSLALAILAHIILFAMLFISFQWRSQPTEPIYAELWNPSDELIQNKKVETPPESDTLKTETQPESVKQETQEQEVPPPPPVTQTKLARKANLLEDPDIVQEQLNQELKKKQEEEKRLLEIERKKEELRKQKELEKIEQQKRLEEQKLKEQLELKRQAEERERKLQEEKRLHEEKLRKQKELQAELKKKREAEKKAAAEAAKRRKEMMNRLTGQSSNAVNQGSSSMTSFQRAQYVNRIVACVRPNIAFNPPAGAKSGQYVASFEVRLLRNATQSGKPRLIKGSGLNAFDAAVERAIIKCDPFPKPEGSDVPRSIILNFDPVDPTTH